MKISDLIKKGRTAKRHSWLIYGESGVGKSSLAADFPNPLFIDLNFGAGDLDVAKVELTDPPSYTQVMSIIDSLVESKGGGYQTLVIDTLGDLEQLIWSHTIEMADDKKIKTIEDFGYGKGYKSAEQYLSALVDSLNRLLTKDIMDVVILAHVAASRFSLEDLTEIIKFAPACQRNHTLPKFERWVSNIGYFSINRVTKENKSGLQVKRVALTTGSRAISFVSDGTYIAKHRANWVPPASIEIPADKPFAAIANFLNADILDEIKVELERIPDDELKNSKGVIINKNSLLEWCKTADSETLKRKLQQLRETAVDTIRISPVE